jgi:hypothetical protein
MKVSRKTIWQMTPQGYELLEEDAFDHDGPVAAAKGGSKGVPDPTAQIAAEQNANQYNVVSPNGSISYSKDPTGRTTQTTTLSPSEQKQLDTSNQIAETMLTGAQKKIPGLADTSFDYNDEGSTAAKAAYQRQVDLLTPEFTKQDAAWEDRMANQGLPTGSEAYLDSQRQHENDKNFALTQAAQQAETEGTQLALSQRQQNYNELAAALGGQQLNPVGSYGSAAAPVDAAGAYAQKNQAAIAAQLADTQSRNALLGAAAQVGGAYLGSRTPSRPSGAGGQAATSGATQNFAAPSNYSSSAPEISNTAGGTTTYFGEPDDGLDYVTPSVSKIGTDAAPAGGWLSTIGKGARTAGDALGIYSGLSEGGVSGYGKAAASGAKLAGDTGLVDSGTTAGKTLGAAGNVYGAYQGVKQGGAQGYATAANDVAGLAGYNIPALSYAGAVDQAAKGDIPGAAISAISTYLPVAGVGFAAASLANKAFFGDKTFQRNSNQWLQDTGAQQVTLGRNLSAIKLPDGTLLPAGAVKDLSAAYYSAAFEGGDPQKYYDALKAVKPMTGYNANAKALVAADTSKGNIHGRLGGP